MKIGKELYSRLRKHRASQDSLTIIALILLTAAVIILASLGAFLAFSPWF